MGYSSCNAKSVNEDQEYVGQGILKSVYLLISLFHER